MKPLNWDALDENGQPYTWDSPNLTWSGILEPGDPGYVPPAASPGKKTSKPKPMKRQDYYPTRQGDQIIWLENFRLKLALYIALLGLDTDRAAGIVSDCRWLAHLIGTWLPAVRAHSAACTQALRQAESGAGGVLALPEFTAPALPAGVTPRDEGALRRVFDFVQEIKENDATTAAIIADLRIAGAEETAPDFDILAPVLTLKLSGSTVHIGWGWQGYGKFLDQCEIQVDRGDGQGWRILTFDTTPDYNDTHPLPAAFTQWKYRAIYRVNDEQVGQWSPIASIGVGG